MPLNDLGARTPGFSFDDYYPSILKAMSYKRTVYVLPRDIAPMAIVYYNKDMLAKAGLPIPDGTWTWDFKPHPEDGPKDFTTYLQRLQQKDPSGKVVRWGLVSDDPTFLIDLFTYSQGARYVDSPEEPTKLLYDDPPGPRRLPTLLRPREQGPPDPLDHGARGDEFAPALHATEMRDVPERHLADQRPAQRDREAFGGRLQVGHRARALPTGMVSAPIPREGRGMRSWPRPPTPRRPGSSPAGWRANTA